jgi:hypothetical protein
MTRGAPIPETVTLHVQFRIVKRGGRKELQLPGGAVQPRRTDCTLVKALARAFRWKRMLESGEFATIADLAAHEAIAPSYMTRVLRLKRCWQTNSNQSQLGQYRCPLCRAKAAPLGESGGPVGLEEMSA